MCSKLTYDTYMIIYSAPSIIRTSIIRHLDYSDLKLDQKGAGYLQKWVCPSCSVVLNVAVTAKPWLLAEGACRSNVSLLFRIARLAS